MATDLNELIKSMSPTLDPKTYVFGHFAPKSNANILDLLVGVSFIGVFQEEEGWTVIFEENEDLSKPFQSTFRSKKITLNVHSSLDAVGFLAAITTRLKELNIGVNPVSGYLHDHLFVPVGREEAVMEALKAMAAGR